MNYNTNEEVWKDAVGYEGFYQVSSLGRVRSVDRIVTRGDGMEMFFKGGIRQPTQTQHGYWRVTTSVNGKYKKIPVHRLVAIAFIPNPNNYKQVNHKDENKSNNEVGNLEWCTQAYNNTYGTRVERMMESEGFKDVHEKNKKPVAKYSLKGDFISEYPSYSDASRELGVNVSNLGACCIGFSLSSHGFIWVHRTEDELKEVERRVNRIKNKNRVIRQYDLEDNFIVEYKSMYEAARETGISRPTLYECCNGHRESYKGYKFEFTN